MTYEISIDGTNYRLELSQIEGRWTCRLDGREIEADAVLVRPDVISLRLGNKAYEVKCERVGSDLHLWVGSVRYEAEVRDPVRCAHARGPLRIMARRKPTAPGPGKVVRIFFVREPRSRRAPGI